MDEHLEDATGAVAVGAIERPLIITEAVLFEAS